jgi:hypothetical protein
MLLLLPIRGLVGDAMAYSMLPSPPATVNQLQVATDLGAARAIFYWASSHLDPQNAAEKTAKQPCHTAQTASNDQDATQNQCSTCQACHLSAATPLQLHDGLLHTTAALPQQRPAQWRSADRRLLAKTPVV